MSHAWQLLAEALGFTPHRATTPFDLRTSFRQLERELRPERAEPPVYTSHHLRGTWCDRRAFVIHHRAGHGDDVREYTTAVVELAQPLHLATVFGSERHVTLLDRVEVPGTRRWLPFQGADTSTPRAFLLAPGPPADLVLQLADAVARGCSVTDSKVCRSLAGSERDPAHVRAALDDCVALAAVLEARRAAVPRSPWDEDVRREWHTFAANRQLTFDEHRGQLRGEIASASLEVAIEERGTQLFTTVETQFPSALGIELEIRKTAAVPRLSRWFGQDLKTGDRAFDDAFVVRGTPADRVRRVFDDSSLRAALVAAVGDADDLRMTQHRLFWNKTSPILERAVLDRHVGAATAAIRAIFANATAAPGPYR